MRARARPFVLRSRKALKTIVGQPGMVDQHRRVTGAVSSKTSFLVTGSDVGASKLSKAKEHNIRTIGEDEFLDLIRTRPGKASEVRASPGRRRVLM